MLFIHTFFWLFFQVAILQLGLMRNLLTRFTSDEEPWFSIVHEKALVQTVVSTAHHALRSRQRPEVVTGAVSILLTLVRSGSHGSESVLSSDLVHLLWLPLSELKTADLKWVGTFTLTLQLVSALLRQAGQGALDVTISFVALLQEQLTSFLLGALSTRATVQPSARHIELTSAAASLISLLFVYYRQWQIQHPVSLANFYHVMAR